MDRLIVLEFLLRQASALARDLPDGLMQDGPREALRDETRYSLRVVARTIENIKRTAAARD